MNNETMKKEPTRRTSVLRQWLLFVVNCLCLLALMLLIRAFVATIFTVPDNSLQPFLNRGDRVLVNRLSRHTLEKGDLVVFGDTCNYIGCIEAVPGDTILWAGEQFLIPKQCHPKCTCGECNIFLINMGRDHSLVARGDVIGKAHRLFKGIGH